MMTKEAKVGLLLGLVFIVSIAIVLKGVGNRSPYEIPSLIDGGAKALEFTGTPLNALSSTIHLDTSSSEARQGINSPLKNDENSRFASQQAPSTSSTNNHQPISEVKSQDLVSEPVTQNNQANRSYRNIATPISPSGDNALDSVRYRAALPNVTVEKQTKYQLKKGQAAISERVARNGGFVKKTTQKVYYIKEGENLSDVALKVYGAVEGKRWVNVEKIYKANTEVIASIDVVTAGLKVIIPPLSGKQEAKVNHRANKITTTKTKRYVVKEGDSLWLISKKLLGNGNRYNEIIKLNKQLQSANALQPGMKIDIPN